MLNSSTGGCFSVRIAMKIRCAPLSRDALAVSLPVAKFPGQIEIRPELMSEAVRYSLVDSVDGGRRALTGLMQSSLLPPTCESSGTKQKQFDGAMVCLQRAEGVHQAGAYRLGSLSDDL